MAKLQVGWDAHRLQVEVKPDKAKYGVRETATASIAVRRPDGSPAAGAEIAFAAVDEALLQLKANPSWDVLDAMMAERPLDVLNSTAQTQIVGKRLYGRKAVEAGGDGGADMASLTRSDFRPMLLWRARVKLDAQGRARIAVPLSDALSSFRLVAVATEGAQLFGTGEAVVRTTQDLQLLAGLPPLVRTGDWYAGIFTLRNASDRAMTVTANVRLDPGIATGRPLTVRIPAGSAVPVAWNVTAPAGIDRIGWTVEAREQGGRASDRVAVTQDVVPAVPVEVWAASIMQAGDVPLLLAAPAGALPGAFAEVSLSDTLAPPLDGVRRYMAGYPYNCFEQQLSRAVALGEAGRWTTLAAALPTYLDSDGLVRYFPDQRMAGSEALTAYVLSITAAAGFEIPAAAKGRMVEAMTAVVEGRLQRDGAGPSDRRYLRVAALGALARNGVASAALTGRIDIAPADMPTALLTDWIAATGGAQRAAADAVLRQRLVWSGTRLDLTDAAQVPWWMMTSGDESAIKALIAVIGRPDWSAEAPRMMLGVTLRQRRGAWDTTPANAWGAVAARRFAASYGGGAITGTTRAGLGTNARTQGWPAQAVAALRLPLGPGPQPLVLEHAGTGRPWATVQVRAAVPLRTPLFAGYRIARSVAFVSRRDPAKLSRGDVLRVTLTVTAGAERNWVVLSDPVPPGATIVGDLGGQSALLAGGESGSGDAPGYIERGRDAWRGYWAWLPAGTTTVSYTVRLNGVGRFTLPPTRVEAMYSPDLRAALPGSTLAVMP